MKTILEIRIGDGKTKPRVCKGGDGSYSVMGECMGYVAYARGLWVRSFEPGSEANPKDGKGLLVGPTRKLTIG